MAWKYIVMEIDTPTGLKMAFPIIFPDKMVHLEVFTVAKLIVPTANEDGSNVRVVIAGMIENVDVDGIGGRSTTLGIKSRGDVDGALFATYPYTHGIT